MDDQQLFQHISDKIDQNSMPFGQIGCLKWVAAKTSISRSRPSGTIYGKMWITLPGERPGYKTVHRLAYMVKTQSREIPYFDSDNNNLKLHVSHLCHCSLCVNPDHLSLEPQHLNNSRQRCRDAKVCRRNHLFNGKSYPDCLFWYLFKYVKR